MNFIKVFNFIMKRLDEIDKLNQEERDELERLFNSLRVRYPSLSRLSSGLLLDKIYLRYGFEG